MTVGFRIQPPTETSTSWTSRVFSPQMVHCSPGGRSPEMGKGRVLLIAPKYPPCCHDNAKDQTWGHGWAAQGGGEGGAKKADSVCWLVLPAHSLTGGIVRQGGPGSTWETSQLHRQKISSV